MPPLASAEQLSNPPPVSQQNSQVLVTGAAGFIGSHLVQRLVDLGENVRGFDNLSTGNLENLAGVVSRHNFNFVRGDCLNPADVERALVGIEHVFHCASDPEVRRGIGDPDSQFRQNVLSTQLLLEEVRRTRSVKSFVFMSTSTVYGNATKLPTPEDYGPLCPISTYGATKLACEALCAAYASSFGFRVNILRLANIVGPRNGHGVIHDFMKKIDTDRKRLGVLGDGTQTKSYLYVSDCVDAILTSWKKSLGPVTVFNVGSRDCVDVATIAKIVIDETAAKRRLEFVGGTSTGAGWVGDVKKMWLDISRLQELGWSPTKDSEDSVRLTIRELLGKMPQERNVLQLGQTDSLLG